MQNYSTSYKILRNFAVPSHYAASALGDESIRNRFIAGRAELHGGKALR